jgi:hypothetical protein
MKNKGLKPMAIPNKTPEWVVNVTFSDSRIADAKLRKIHAEAMARAERLGLEHPTFATAVDPRLSAPQQHKHGPSNRRILITACMAVGCGLTLLVQLIFGG